jgi:urease accessory protein
MNALTLLLLDSRAPTGASAHSAGLEAAVEAGWVRDLDDLAAFCAGRLRTSGRVAAAFAAAACTDPARWRELDAEFEARTASEAMRSSSRALGAGLRRLLRAMVPEFAATDRDWGAVTPHHPIVLGVACALTGATAADAARAAALAVITTPATAAIRLLGLDPYAVHAMLANLAPQVDALSTTFGGLAPDTVLIRQKLGKLPADTAIALDLLADVHLHQEVRLFAS